MPESVADEIRKGRELDSAMKAIESSEWLRVIDTPAVPPLVQAWDLGPGESAVLCLRAYRYGGSFGRLGGAALR